MDLDQRSFCDSTLVNKYLINSYRSWHLCFRRRKLQSPGKRKWVSAWRFPFYLSFLIRLISKSCDLAFRFWLTKILCVIFNYIIIPPSPNRNDLLEAFYDLLTFRSVRWCNTGVCGLNSKSVTWDGRERSPQQQVSWLTNTVTLLFHLFQCDLEMIVCSDFRFFHLQEILFLITHSRDTTWSPGCTCFRPFMIMIRTLSAGY